MDSVNKHAYKWDYEELLLNFEDEYGDEIFPVIENFWKTLRKYNKGCI